MGDMMGINKDNTREIYGETPNYCNYMGRVWGYNKDGSTFAYNLDPKDYGYVIKEYTQMIHHDPDYAVAYNNRGWAYYMKGDWDQAIADFETALRLDPNNAFIKRNLENALQARGR
jgi:tetratricopeptide (TPR) repeat protein